MPYSLPFAFLSRADVHLILVDPHGPEIKRLYFDCLAMLHDLVAQYCSDPDAPIFERFNQKINMLRIGDSIGLLPPQAVSIGKNMRLNAETAFDLQQQFIIPNPRIRGYAAHLMADDYVRRLLIQYANLR